jgi:hypothetical protein
MTSALLSTSGLMWILYVTLVSLYFSFILSFISFRAIVILALLGSAFSIDLKEACDTPVKPASRARNRARSYSISSSGSSSIPMSRRLPSRHQSPIVLRPPLNPPSTSGGSQRSDPEQGSIVPLTREMNDNAAPSWNRFWNPGPA